MADRDNIGMFARRSWGKKYVSLICFKKYLNTSKSLYVCLIANISVKKKKKILIFLEKNITEKS